MHIQSHKTLVALAVLTCCASSAQAQQNCSQSTDPTMTANGSVACINQANNFHVDNAYLRRYSPPNDCMEPNGMQITGVTFGIEAAVGGLGVQPANVRLYTIAPAATLIYGNMTMVHDEPIMINDQTQSLISVQLSGPVAIPPGVDVVVEVFTPDGQMAGNVFFMGSNGLGQSAPSYLAAAGCGAAEPMDLANLGPGFPNVHFILDLESNISTLGTAYCTPGVVNSSGSDAKITAMGSIAVIDNSVTLVTLDMPTNSFGFFLTSTSQGMVTNPGGSAGTLCLGGSIGRFVGPGQVQNSGQLGSISLAIDLTAQPTPQGLVAVVAGETWNFQTWFRDFSGGVVTSNFSHGLEITFQ